MPFPSEPRPWSFYRLGPTKEKGLFKRRRETYDGVVVPAHIASYYSKFCSEFIGSLGKPYIIDPLTYIFANDPLQIKRFLKNKKTGRTLVDRFGNKRKGDVKRSYRKLVENEYTEIIGNVVAQGRSVIPADFENVQGTEQFVTQVVAFQRDRLASIPAKYKKYERYAKKSGRSPMAEGNAPMCIVAPYFATRTLDARGWHSTNVRLIKVTKSIAEKIPVFAVILADTMVLARDVERIASEYSSAGADGFLLWPDGFTSNQDLAALRVVFNAVEVLNRSRKPVILMYGDAFSLVLHYAGLAGFACGIGYGERKSSTQDTDIEGLIPPRYYLRRLKKKVQIETEARRIRIERYPDLVCKCEICLRKPDPVTLDDTECREHFMLTRASEIGELRGGLSRDSFASMLREAYEVHEGHPVLQPIGHLRNWASVLGEDGA